MVNMLLGRMSTEKLLDMFTLMVRSARFRLSIAIMITVTEILPVEQVNARDSEVAILLQGYQQMAAMIAACMEGFAFCLLDNTETCQRWGGSATEMENGTVETVIPRSSCNGPCGIQLAHTHTQLCCRGLLPYSVLLAFELSCRIPCWRHEVLVFGGAVVQSVWGALGTHHCHKTGSIDLEF